MHFKSHAWSSTLLPFCFLLKQNYKTHKKKGKSHPRVTSTAFYNTLYTHHTHKNAALLNNYSLYIAVFTTAYSV